MNKTSKELIKLVLLTLILSLLSYKLFPKSNFAHSLVNGLSFFGLLILIKMHNINWKIKLFSTILIFTISILTIKFLYGYGKTLYNYIYIFSFLIAVFLVETFVNKKFFKNKD